MSDRPNGERRAPREAARGRSGETPWPRSWEWEDRPPNPERWVDLTPGAAFTIRLDGAEPAVATIVREHPTADPRSPFLVVQVPGHPLLTLRRSPMTEWYPPQPRRGRVTERTRAEVAQVQTDGTVGRFDRSAELSFAEQPYPG